MSRASTVTKLPLADWFRYMGIHPLHAEQVRLEETPNQICSDIYFQHEWQTADHVSREEIARAIKEAEDRIEQFLGFHLTPCWEYDEWHMTARVNQQDLVNHNGADIRGFKSSVHADWGWFISGGIRGSTLLDADATIVYTDPDGDGYDETAKVVVATTVTDKNEIRIYYPGKDGADNWEIRPTQVVISGGNATITFRRELVVVEEKLEAFDIEGMEAVGTVDDDFISKVDVYRVYNDPSKQATFLWEPFANVCASCASVGCSQCSFNTQEGCLISRSDPRQSIIGFSPATWDADEEDFLTQPWSLTRMPEVVRLYYYSGWRNKNASYTSRLDDRMARMIAYYAAALLDRPPCECSADVWRRWRQDLSMDSGDEDGQPIFRTPSGSLDNPFGTRRGEVNAWRMINSQSSPAQPILRAVVL